MTAEARADYTALLWEQQEAAREATFNRGEYEDALDRLAALIPHPYLIGRGGCSTCRLPEGAAIHHWDDAEKGQAAA